jgi:hypothetical protein
MGMQASRGPMAEIDGWVRTMLPIFSALFDQMEPFDRTVHQVNWEKFRNRQKDRVS